MIYKGKENWETAQHLKQGDTCIVVGFGQSMTPILKSGQPVKCEPVTKDTALRKNDIMLCKVKGHFYLHKISAIRNSVSYQISNNHGHVNGWISRNGIYGRVTVRFSIKEFICLKSWKYCMTRYCFACVASL